MLPIIIGFYGTIPNSAVEAVHTLGIERKRANKLLLALHTHAITTLHAMVTLVSRTGEVTETAQLNPPPPPPP